MVFVAAITVLSLILATGLGLAGMGGAVAVAHIAFAIGIVPLILGAMSHFVPVLTRSGSPAKAIKSLPFLAQGAGILAVVAMEGLGPRWLLSIAAMVDASIAATLLGWIIRRAKGAIGTPHPGWRWYGAALCFLLLALAAVPPLLAVPSLYAPLRAFHLHLNTLGWVGIAALGTLPVLLPTALGRPDPAAAAWLRRRLWPITGSVLMVAMGAALAWPLALLGALLLAALIAELLAQWQRSFGIAAVLKDGAASSLAGAALGLVLLVVGGMLHGAGIIPGRPAIAAWAAGFLLPLVTGALSQLLPVWRWPGPVTPERQRMRTELAATGRARAACFLASASFLITGLTIAGGAMAAAGLGLFALGIVQAVRVRRPAR